MKKDKRYVVSILYLIIGILLIGLSIAGKVDAFWNGMGSALLVVGILQLIRFYRFNQDEVYHEKVETELNDERNSFIRNKAWAWAGYMFVMIAAVASIILKIAGQDILSMAASVVVGLVLILFWGSYHILKRKY